jgi:hypothetical protein
MWRRELAPPAMLAVYDNSIMVDAAVNDRYAVHLSSGDASCGSRVVLGFFNGSIVTVLSLDASTGATLFSRPLGPGQGVAAILGSLTVDGDMYFVVMTAPSAISVLSRISRQGDLLWNRPLTGYARRLPVSACVHTCRTGPQRCRRLALLSLRTTASTYWSTPSGALSCRRGTKAGRSCGRGARAVSQAVRVCQSLQTAPCW